MERGPQVEWPSGDALRRVVDAFASRFGNSREPEKTERVMTYIRDRVAAGALAIVKSP